MNICMDSWQLYSAACIHTVSVFVWYVFVCVWAVCVCVCVSQLIRQAQGRVTGAIRGFSPHPASATTHTHTHTQIAVDRLSARQEKVRERLHSQCYLMKHLNSKKKSRVGHIHMYTH